MTILVRQSILEVLQFLDLEGSYTNIEQPWYCSAKARTNMNEVVLSRLAHQSASQTNKKTDIIGFSETHVCNSRTRLSHVIQTHPCFDFDMASVHQTVAMSRQVSASAQHLDRPQRQFDTPHCEQTVLVISLQTSQYSSSASV